MKFNWEIQTADTNVTPSAHHFTKNTHHCVGFC